MKIELRAVAQALSTHLGASATEIKDTLRTVLDEAAEIEASKARARLYRHAEREIDAATDMANIENFRARAR